MTRWPPGSSLWLPEALLPFTTQHQRQPDTVEPAIPDASVKPKDSASTVIDSSSTSNADGFYYFTDPPPKTDLMQFEPPGGFTQVSPLNVGTDDVVSVADTAPTLITATTEYTGGDFDDTLDAGYFVLGNLGNIILPD